jgi:hypothetical protein
MLDTLDEIMLKMPESWRYRWCEPGSFGCACMGAANCSGKIGSRFTKAEWEEWARNNPPENDESAKQFIVNGKYDIDAHYQWMFKKSANIAKQFNINFKNKI